MDQTRQTIAYINTSRAARRGWLRRVLEKADALRAARREGQAARREWGRRFLDERRRLRREAAALWQSLRGA